MAQEVKNEEGKQEDDVDPDELFEGLGAMDEQ